MSDIVLAAPQHLGQPAVRVRVTGYEVGPESLRAEVVWIDADGSVVKRETIGFTGAAFAGIDDDLITAGNVGLKIGKLYERKIRQAVKALYNLDGAVA